MTRWHDEIETIADWLAGPRFEGIVRLYSAREVAEQRGTIAGDYAVARVAADAFHARLRELFVQGRSITTFGPYSPGQAVTMKRLGLEGIYLGGWATSAKGSRTEDPGADLASYPLSQVPDEAATIVRALLTADKNQHFMRSRMTDAQRSASTAVDFRPFIIADADTGHGGDAHVRNLIRRFVEVGVPGYHIEDQKPGVKKCGHQGGKVLVAQDEQIKRLNAARFQLDVMGVPGIVVARTDAESAALIDSAADERDHPFLLGATHSKVPTYKAGYIAVLRRLHELGLHESRGHLLFALTERDYRAAYEWLAATGVMSLIEEAAAELCSTESVAGNGTAAARLGGQLYEASIDRCLVRYIDEWQIGACMQTYSDAVAAEMKLRLDEGYSLDMTIEAWLAFSRRASLGEAREQARAMDVDVFWDADIARTPDGYYQVQGGLEYAIARSLAVAPFADILWMETKTADLGEARLFAEAIHAVFPDKLLAYNLSPSFNWDTTGMSDEEMRRFPEALGALGYVFNFITYGGHQIDGLAAEEFATALKQDGMLALARLQRKFRLVESPYRTPQTLVGGPRQDAALTASTGRTATTKAMGKGSTQFQHLALTEVPTKLLVEWLESWAQHHEKSWPLRVELRPHTAGSELLQLMIRDDREEPVANVIFTHIHDRRNHSILSVRDQNTFADSFRKKRLMTLVHLYLIHRYKAVSVHYVSPTEDNQYQASKMKEQGIYSDVTTEIGQIIVAGVNAEGITSLLHPDRRALQALIKKVALPA